MKKQDQHIVIRVSKTPHVGIFSRTAVKKLFSLDLIDVSSIEVDFRGVSFISRAVAHEFLSFARKFREKEEISVEFIGCTEEVQQMLDTVKSSMGSEEEKKMSLIGPEPIRFSDSKAFEDFLKSG